MKHLGSRRHTGILCSTAGEEFGEVAFTLDVYEHRGLKDGTGTLTSAVATLHRAFEAGSAILRYGMGLEFRLVIDHLGDGAATYKTSGPIPGF